MKLPTLSEDIAYAISCVQDHRDTIDTDISYGIHEIYYDENGDIVNISESLAHPISDDLGGLRWNLKRMMEACKKPVIDYNTGEEVN
jgi:hypothetical protein